MSKTVKRLYKHFIPERYDLTINPDKLSKIITGKVTITGHKVGPPSHRITFHQNGLKITKATITKIEKRSKNTVIPVSRIQHHRSFDEVRLHTDTTLYSGTYVIEIEYRGNITTQMNGIYPCNFDYDNKKDQLIATQFESHHAREAFPCIDEPEAKAVFNLTLHTPTDQTVIANTPIKTQTTNNDTLITVFEPTPHMSTYLLAFVYGRLEYLETKTKSGIIVRTYATPDNVQYTKFALEVAAKCLDFYNDYYGIDYPLEKCDFIALPDFASGAMENWGCITFREQTLLVDPKNTSLSIKQYVALVVAHELAHQWFGNLVTMRWWTDLWLNEGFASWMEYFAVDNIFPEWNMWNEFIVSEQEPGLKLDALEFTHPVEVPIHHPDEIRTIFDSISYSKGSSLLYMLHEYIGAADFQKGIRHYLKIHAYKNTDTNDLWESFEIASGKDIKGFMNRWTLQSGFPLVRVNFNERTYEVELSQTRFILNPLSKIRSNDDATWPVPLLTDTIISKDNILATNSLSAKIENSDSNKNLVNKAKHGFYRTVYDESQIKLFASLIKKGQIDMLDRLTLLGDAFEAAKAQYIDTNLALTLLEAFTNEDNMFVWEVIATNLASIRTVMDDESLREDLKPYTIKLIKGQLERLGWDQVKNESHFDTLLRPTILSMAAVSDEPTVVEHALKLFNDMKKPTDINPDLRGVVYGTVARRGDKAEFDKLLNLHNKSTNSEERLTLSAALTNFKDPKIITEALKQITSENVRVQDAAYWIAYSFMNRFAKEQTWLWLKEHWQWLKENMGTDLSFYRFPLYAARAFSDKGFLDEYTAFFSQYLDPAFERPFKQGVETIEWQATWRETNLKKVKDYFKGYKA